MGHGVRNVIEHDAKRESGKLLGILRAVRPFPGVAQMHVVADRHHHAAAIVANGAPLRHVAVLFVGSAGVDILLAGNLEAVVDVVERVEELVLILEVFDGAIRKTPCACLP
jgi:hypothetical protein